MISYHNDTYIRFDHSPQSNKEALKLNQVGVDEPYYFAEVDYDDTDSNTIYVSTNGDDGNEGTYSSPKKTIAAAINATTALKNKVVVIDSDQIFNEDISSCDFTYLQGIFQISTGGTSCLIYRQLGFTPSNSNSIFIASTGADGGSADGTMEKPYKTINYAKNYCDSSHQKIGILDSATYEEEGFEFSGNFKSLYSVIGQSPIITLTNPSIDVETFEFITVDGVGNYSLPTTWPYNTLYDKALMADNGDVIIIYRESNLLKFKIVDKTGSLKLSPVTLTSGDIYGSQASLLDNNNIAIFYRLTSTNHLYFCVYTQAGACVKAETQVTVNALVGPDYFNISNLHDSGFVIIYGEYSGTYNSYFSIYTNEGALVTRSLYKSGEARIGDIIPLKSVYRFVIINKNLVPGYGGTFFVFSNTGNLIQGETYIHGEFFPGDLFCGASFSNGYFVIAWKCNKSDYTYYKEPFYAIYNYNGTLIKSPDLVSSYTDVNYISAFVDGEDNVIICIVENSDTDKVSAAYITTSGITNTTTLSASSPDGSAVALIQMQDDACYIYQKKSGSALCQHSFLKELLFTAITVSTDVSINGIIFDQNGIGGMYTLFSSGSNKISLAYCEIKNCNPDTISDSGFVIVGDINEIKNSKIHDCNNGINTSVTSYTVEYCQFYRITEGYAFYNDGSASATIEHCDFFQNYGGIYLNNNSGSEVIKNNIFHDNSIYDVYATNAIEITYSVTTGTVGINVTRGAAVTRANPNYINEGYDDPDAIDLNIKVRILGYTMDSPAYSLADDNKNAGSLDVEYIGTAVSYTSITVPKPNTIKLSYQHAGVANTQRADGSWASKKTGTSEIAEMEWDGLDAEYVQDLFELITCENKLVNIYPDPITYPNAYEQWAILRESTPIGVATPTLSDLGVQNLKIKFAKAV